MYAENLMNCYLINIDVVFEFLYSFNIVIYKSIKPLYMYRIKNYLKKFMYE